MSLVDIDARTCPRRVTFGVGSADGPSREHRGGICACKRSVILKLSAVGEVVAPLTPCGKPLSLDTLWLGVRAVLEEGECRLHA